MLSRIGNWDDLRIFLAVARAGNIVKAAAELRIDQSTVSRRLSRLQEHLGAPLFVRHRSGLQLSPIGDEVIRFAGAMEQAMAGIEGATANLDKAMRGTIHVTATEGLAGYWLAAKLRLIQRQFPGLAFNLDTSDMPRDRIDPEADIAICFSNPQAAPQAWPKVGEVQLRPYAASSYLHRHGVPKSLDDLNDHRLIRFDGPLRGRPWPQWFSFMEGAKQPAFRTNSPLVHARMLRDGMGIGLMPRYIAEGIEGVEEIQLSFGEPIELFVATHDNRRHAPSVRVALSCFEHFFRADGASLFSA